MNLPSKRAEFRRLTFLGFCNNIQLDVTRLCFTFMRAFGNAIYLLNQSNRELIECHVDVQLKCLHQTGLKSDGWLSMTTEGCCLCDPRGLSNLNNAHITALAPLVIASHDTEAFSPENRFPDANKEGDALFMIATAFSALVKTRHTSAILSRWILVNTSQEFRLSKQWMQVT